MSDLNYKEAFEKLRRAGLTSRTISCLARLRRKFAASELDQAPVEQYRLEFVRWLVVTHRLTEQLEAPCGIVSAEEAATYPEVEK